jgi:PST family polysaccharide transporter
MRDAGQGADGVGRLVRRGASWTLLNLTVSRLGQFLLGVIVARIVAPADFGVFAVALVVQMIVTNASEMGVSTALFRGDQAAIDRRGPTVTTIALASSGVLAVTMALGAPGLAHLLDAPRASGVIAVLALTVALSGLAAVPSVLLTRGFRNDLRFVADLASLIVGGVVLLLLARAGWGPMALAWSRVASQAVAVVFLTLFAPTRYRPGFARTEARALLAFGLPLCAANMLSWAILNVDYIVIGRLLGSASLGLYMLAFNISSWPTNTLSAVVRSVALPAFARLHRESPDGVPRDFRLAFRKVAALSFPVALFIGALAQPLVRGVYGNRWIGAATALTWLALFGAFRTTMDLFVDFLIALGRTRRVMAVQLLWLGTLIPAMVVGVRVAGLAGAGAAHVAVAALLVMPAYVLAGRKVGVAAAPLLRLMLVILAWSGFAATIARLAASRFPNPWLACLAGGFAGTAVYLIPYVRTIWRMAVQLWSLRVASGKLSFDHLRDADARVEGEAAVASEFLPSDPMVLLAEKAGATR